MERITGNPGGNLRELRPFAPAINNIMLAFIYRSNFYARYGAIWPDRSATAVPTQA